jgi:hypothetical protein
MDVEPRRMSRADVHLVFTKLMVVRSSWQHGSTCFCWLLACKWQFSDCKPHSDLRSSYHNGYVVPSNTVLSPIKLNFAFVCLGSSLIHKGMIITRQYRIRKVALWAIVQFAWTQLIDHPRMHQANQVGEAHVRAHHIVLHHVLTYSCVAPLIP